MIPDIDMGVVNICTPCEGGVYQVWVWESSFEKVWKYYSLSDDGISYGEIEEIRLPSIIAIFMNHIRQGEKKRHIIILLRNICIRKLPKSSLKKYKVNIKRISLNWKPLESWKQAE